jgi:hypothetical protein
MLLFSSICLKHGHHSNYWIQPLNMRMRVCYLDCHETGMCCHLVIHAENLLHPLQLFYFHVLPIYWLSLLKAGNFLTTWVTVIFSKWTWLNGVSSIACFPLFRISGFPPRFLIVIFTFSTSYHPSSFPFFHEFLHSSLTSLISVQLSQYSDQATGCFN